MKKWVFFVLFVVLAVGVSAMTYLRGATLVNGFIGLNDSVVCERERHSGMIHLQKDLTCCIDEDGTGRCDNAEPLVGYGKQKRYLWPTITFRPSFSHRLMYVPCEGISVITGNEYKPFLEKNGCEQTGSLSYCCPENAFVPEPTQSTGLASSEDLVEFESKNNPVMVVREYRWRLAELGKIHDLYIEKAMRTEKERCANGGGDVFRFDEGQGSYFSDTKNYHEGDRVFMFIKPDYDVVPLISWCE